MDEIVRIVSYNGFRNSSGLNAEYIGQILSYLVKIRGNMFGHIVAKSKCYQLRPSLVVTFPIVYFDTQSLTTVLFQ